ncbi:MAG: T9SS type A sorting domain-containing protein, partial [Candidatus Eisenbacteria bacterium]|nr:T9SS type A sorting domain-containing protein [Candidatus Eisenbacteria bacterium]
DLPIPDNNPSGVSDEMEISIGASVSMIEVYVDITHTYIGDLIVRLQSPEGTTVTLHDRSGGSADNLVGWYPSELTPAESLDAFIGETTDGTWTLFVSDNAGADLGTLNEWCLRITYAGEAPSGAPDGGIPKVLALRGNAPNPLQAETLIRFDLPQAARVDLGIFDVGGRRVATLVDGNLPAGRHRALWNGRDAAGRAAASGIYFARLTAGSDVLTHKMILMK